MSIEQYLWVCLGEECAELAQAASKSNRFGLDDVWPGKPTTNRTDIKREFNDLLAVIEMLADNGILESNIVDEDLIKEKKAKISRMMLHSYARGRVVEP